MRVLTQALLLIVAAVNLLPVIGALSTDRLGVLYGVVLDEPNLAILMRHRAILFGIVGGLLVASVFSSRLRPIAIAAGLVSMLSFVFIAYSVGAFNSELRRIVRIDLVASVLLVGAAITTYRAKPARDP